MNKKRFIFAVPLLLIGLSIIFIQHYYPSDCPNLKCSLQKDTELAKKFDSNIPLFFELSNSDSLLEALPEFKNDSKILHMLDVLTANTLRMRQSSIVQPTCAIVGNSQNLTGSGYGERIDKHDYVFRMNSPPVESYEKDVGSRTTHHVFYHISVHTDNRAYSRSYSPDTIHILMPLTEGVREFYESHLDKNHRVYKKFFFNLAEALSSHKNISPPPLQRNDLTQLRELPNLVVMSPDFLWYTHYSWFAPKNRDEKHIASTGFMTVILALHLCDKIDLYGFGRDASGLWGYYFQSKKMKAAIHRPGYQEQFFDMLEDKKVIRLWGQGSQ